MTRLLQILFASHSVDSYYWFCYQIKSSCAWRPYHRGNDFVYGFYFYASFYLSQMERQKIIRLHAHR